MNNGLQTDSTEQARRPGGLFLCVDSSGKIVGVRELRHDFVGCETWFSEYSGQHLGVQRLYPSGGPLEKLKVSPELRQNIERRRNLYFSEIVHHARHEAGHASTCCTLRLERVNFISVNLKVRPDGNLFDQIAARELIAPKLVKGATSVGDPNNPSLEPLKALAWACHSLGGIAGCGDDIGAEDDLGRFHSLVASISEFDRAAVGRLQTELQSLANDIIRDPIVSPRHSELARCLSESKFLDREGVEKILLPASLPDYSPRLAEIAKKFNVGGAAGKRRSFSLSEFPL
jgi:hypothetical protein